MYVGGDPTKVDVSGYTQGDILAADASGELVPVPVGADATILTADSTDAEGVEWAVGGAAGSTLIVRQARITTGNVTLPNTAGGWQAVPGFSLAIAASVGDYVDIVADFLSDTASSGFLDLAVSVNGVLTRYMSSGTGTPSVEGIPGLYPNYVDFFARYSPLGFQVEAGDLFGGNVTWVLAANAAGVGDIFASASFPFYWRTINYRAADFA
jgi:hypothetical protein